MEERFGEFGGQFVPETLMNSLASLEKEFREALEDGKFLEELDYYLRNYSSRPTPLYYAKRLTEYFDRAKIYLKREDLNHTGAHKINNVLGQVLLAKRMGKKNLIAETGAGQHGVATATVAAMMGLNCIVFMGEKDIERQYQNLMKMKLLGAQVIGVSSGSGTLKDATNEAIRYWVAHPEDSFYVIGSVVGPHPYPTMVRTFQKVIGEETRDRLLELEGRLPDYLIACVGGGSNALGLFYPFIDKDVRMFGVEAGGLGIETGQHASSIAKGKKGVIHGMMTYLLRDDYGQILPAYSISAGLDYPAIGPEHAYYHETGRVQYVSVTDKEALQAFKFLTKMEGIVPALESSHALAYLFKMISTTRKDELVVLNLSGRGDKDLARVLDYKEEEDED